MKTAIVIATYNEKENIELLIREILSLPLSEIEIIVVDDNSPDRTGEIVAELASENFNLQLLSRPKKMGLAGACFLGMEEAIKRGADLVMTLDADFSHDPKSIPFFIEAAENHELIIGSRYIPGGQIQNWDWVRRLVSQAGNFYARSILRLPFRDLTTGYKCYRKNVAQELIQKSEKNISSGYVFQIETIYWSHQNNFKIKEIPIIFSERRLGRSKFNLAIIWESFWRILALRFSK